MRSLQSCVVQALKQFEYVDTNTKRNLGSHNFIEFFHVVPPCTPQNNIRLCPLAYSILGYFEFGLSLIVKVLFNFHTSTRPWNPSMGYRMNLTTVCSMHVVAQSVVYAKELYVNPIKLASHRIRLYRIFLTCSQASSSFKFFFISQQESSFRKRSCSAGGYK